MGFIRDILLIDESPDGGTALADFLSKRGMRPFPVNTVRTGLAALQRGRETGAPFHLVIGTIRNLAVDGLGFLRELKRWQDPIPVILAADYGSIDPQVANDIQAMGVLTILDLPIDHDQLAEILLQQAAAGSSAPAPATTASLSAMQFAPADLPPQPVLQDSLMPVRTVINRQQATAPISTTGTLRQRRSVDTVSTVRQQQPPMQPRNPTPPPGMTGLPPQPRYPTPLPGALAMPRNPTPPPGMTGPPPQPRYPTPLPGAVAQPRRPTPQPGPPVAPTAMPIDPGNVRKVTCGACMTVLTVERKATAYVTVCVRCGSMLRIEPG